MVAFRGVLVAGAASVCLLLPAARADAGIVDRSPKKISLTFEGRTYSSAAPDAPSGKPPFLILNEMHDAEGHFYFVNQSAGGLKLFEQAKENLLSNAVVYGGIHWHSPRASLVDAWLDAHGQAHTMDAFQQQLDFSFRLRSSWAAHGLEKGVKIDFPERTGDEGLEKELKLHYPERTSDPGLALVPITGITDRATLMIPHSELQIRQSRLEAHFWVECFKANGNQACAQAPWPNDYIAYWRSKLDASRSALELYKQGLELVPLSRPTPLASFVDDWPAFSGGRTYAGLKLPSLPQMGYQLVFDSAGKFTIGRRSEPEPEDLVAESVNPDALTPERMLALQALQDKAISAVVLSSDVAEGLLNIRLPRLR